MFTKLCFNLRKFKDVNLNDPFFNSFKKDYKVFCDWVTKKQESDTFVFYYNNKIKDFIFLEIRKHKIKLCTLKLEKECSNNFDKIIENLINLGLEKNKNIYFTAFPHHTNLIKKFEEKGFIKVGNKGKEIIYEYFV